MYERSRVQTRLPTVMIELGCPRNLGNKNFIFNYILKKLDFNIYFLVFYFIFWLDQQKKPLEITGLTNFITYSRCRMTPITRPKPQKPSIVLCYIFVVVVTVYLVVHMSYWQLVNMPIHIYGFTIHILFYFL